MLSGTLSIFVPELKRLVSGYPSLVCRCGVNRSRELPIIFDQALLIQKKNEGVYLKFCKLAAWQEFPLSCVSTL